MIRYNDASEHVPAASIPEFRFSMSQLHENGFVWCRHSLLRVFLYCSRGIPGNLYHCAL